LRRPVKSDRQDAARKEVTIMRSYREVESGGDKEGCDIRIWSGSCEHVTEMEGSDTYLCDTCGVIEGLDHEVRHDGYPHVSGDYDSLY